MADSSAVFYEESKNTLAETPNPRDPATLDPWTPDATKRPGTPPVAGKGGERGSSAYEGSGFFTGEAGGVIEEKAVPDTHYPLHGVEYWEGSTPTGNHA